MTSPCYNCPQRGCGSYHDQCERYQTFCRERRKQSERRKELLTMFHTGTSRVKKHPKWKKEE